MPQQIARITSWLLFGLAAVHIVIDGFFLGEGWSHLFSFATYFSGMPIAFLNSFLIITGSAAQLHQTLFSICVLLGTLAFAYWTDYLIKRVSSKYSPTLVFSLIALSVANFGLTYLKGLMYLPFALGDGQEFSRAQSVQWALTGLSLVQILTTIAFYGFWVIKSRDHSYKKTDNPPL
jgi:hypothetical protein